MAFSDFSFGVGSSVISCPRSTIDSPRHFQTSTGSNTNNFCVKPNHPRRPQTPLTEPQIIQDFQLFEIGRVTLTPPRSNWQLPPRSMALEPSDTIWMDSFEPKDGIIKVERWPSLTVGTLQILSLYRVKANGLLAGRWQMCQREVVPDQQ